MLVFVSALESAGVSVHVVRLMHARFMKELWMSSGRIVRRGAQVLASGMCMPALISRALGDTRKALNDGDGSQAAGSIDFGFLY